MCISIREYIKYLAFNYVFSWLQKQLHNDGQWQQMKEVVNYDACKLHAQHTSTAAETGWGYMQPFTTD